MAYNSIPPAGFPDIPSVSALDEIKDTLSTLRDTMATINAALDDLEERVEALEGGEE